MRSRSFLRSLLALSAFFTSLASPPTSATTISDSSLGYAITLPADWIQVKAKPDQHYFRDGSRVHRSQISILKYSIDKATYPTPESWTQAQFIAYKLSVETSAYPYGAVAFYDSASAVKLGSVWAPEAFSVLYPADGDPTYCEFMRYGAVGEAGYEIYAIGDSTDMVSNVDYYAGIIATLQFAPPSPILIPAMRRLPGRKESEGFRIYDLAGRLIRKTAASRVPIPFRVP
ncbi:MAG: hypothetical protein JWP91_178 [Fibrobacteres bacterium]|nr:hypothetical protein [Fibrobacterota bacterium]